MIFLFPSPTFSYLMQRKSKFRRNMKVVSFFHLLGKTYPLFIISPFLFTFFPISTFSLPFSFSSPTYLFSLCHFFHLFDFYYFSISSSTHKIETFILSFSPSQSHSLLSTVYPAACPFPSSFPDRHNKSLTEGFFLVPLPSVIIGGGSLCC